MMASFPLLRGSFTPLPPSLAQLPFVSSSCAPARPTATQAMASLRATVIFAMLACMLLMKTDVVAGDVVALGADGLTIKSTDFHANSAASKEQQQVGEDDAEVFHGFEQELVVLGH
ncbi:hypothetical protein BHM03_00001096 [Ensete ventricosum]|uniref:Uncharacterized protein n=2 Tax=Ensete ventricosum TaxID=4639 RepID=A0A445M8W8_ENSVE|nr:hypothetical protein BHM03_00001096 [Ensete ventricosum]